jgi:hypothetical protein
MEYWKRETAAPTGIAILETVERIPDMAGGSRYGEV